MGDVENDPLFGDSNVFEGIEESSSQKANTINPTINNTQTPYHTLFNEVFSLKKLRNKFK